ncbi:MAG: NAD-dependent epimerase/dehydratase family protein [Anaerolineae bacterium]|nr:NAD-dependent epimerase/dehydratase family protein [Anaerolineae bacterium]
MILVTGGTGFLGRNMLPLLLQAGYAVRVITRQPEAYPWLGPLPVDIFQGDITDLPTVQRATEGARYVIHAAGLWRFWGRAADFEAANTLGTHNVLEAARQAGVEKLVYVSTIAVAGYPREPILIDETCPPQPVDAYQRSKLAAEQLLLAAHQSGGLRGVIVRGGLFMDRTAPMLLTSCSLKTRW